MDVMSVLASRLINLLISDKAQKMAQDVPLTNIYIYKSNNVCVRVHVFFIDGQSFKPISMRFETWVPLISRKVKTKFSHKKSDPLPPKFG